MGAGGTPNSNVKERERIDRRLKGPGQTLLKITANWCDLVRIGAMGNNVEGRAGIPRCSAHPEMDWRLGRSSVVWAWGLYSFEHGDTLHQEDGQGLLVEEGLY